MFTMAERTEKVDDKKGEKNMKTPQQETSIQKKLTQLNSKSVRLSVLKINVSNKLPCKKPRTCNGEKSSNGASEVTINTGELKIIQENLREIKDTMVKRSAIKDIVSALLSELKGEIKEIISEIKGEIKQEYEIKLEEKAKHFELQSKEIADELNLDLETLREKFPVKFGATIKAVLI